MNGLKSGKATGPDNVSSRLLKAAGELIVATSATLPQEWQCARIAAAYKKEDETNRDNYRPLSMLLSLPRRNTGVTAGETRINNND